MNPSCEDRDTCDKARKLREHPGYDHADSWSEVHRALATGIEVRDVDGDPVAGVRVVTATNDREVTYRRDGGGVDTYQVMEAESNYILLPDSTLGVSEEEEAAALASILGVRGDLTVPPRWGDVPYDSKAPAEVIHDYAVVRGDLSEQYARDQLAGWVERLVRERQAEAWTAALHHVQPHLDSATKRAAMLDNPYRSEAT